MHIKNKLKVFMENNSRKSINDLSHNLLNQIATYLFPHEFLKMYLVSKNNNFTEFIEYGNCWENFY